MDAAPRLRPTLDTADGSPPHERLVELYAANGFGTLGPQTLWCIMLHAGRAIEHHRLAAGLAVALAHLNDVGGATGAELATLAGKSVTWADCQIALGRSVEGMAPRRAARKQAAG